MPVRARDDHELRVRYVRGDLALLGGGEEAVGLDPDDERGREEGEGVLERGGDCLVVGVVGGGDAGQLSGEGGRGGAGGRVGEVVSVAFPRDVDVAVRVESAGKLLRESQFRCWPP